MPCFRLRFGRFGFFRTSNVKHMTQMWVDKPFLWERFMYMRKIMFAYLFASSLPEMGLSGYDRTIFDV